MDQNLIEKSLSYTAPSQFRIIAIISTYNEEDIIIPVVNHLQKEGIEVYIVDNWSTDQTYKLLEGMAGELVGLERFPPDKPAETYDWEAILERKEALSKELDADWFMHHDADEIRESPWQNLSLRDAIYVVDQLGYNAIDFALLNFFPVDNGFQSGMSIKEYFKYFQYNDLMANELQVKTWKKTSDPVDLIKTGGHNVDFLNKKVFPCKFIMRHYPIRSQSHGERKVLLERKSRFNPVERERGWHIQYDDYTENTSFLKKPDELLELNANTYVDSIIRQFITMEKNIESLQQAQVETQTKLSETQTQLVETQTQLVETQTQLAEAQTQLVELQTQLVETQTQLAETQAQLVRKQTELADTQTQFVGLQTQLVDTQTKSIETQTQLAELQTQSVAMQTQFAEVQTKNRNLQNQLTELLASKSWRIINYLRKLRDRLAPPDSLQRKVIQKIIFRIWHTVEFLRTRKNIRKIVASVRDSHLFDEDYYFKNYPDVFNQGIDPVRHYCEFGWREGRNPNKDFDTNFYLSENQDVLIGDICPLYHWIQWGKNEGRLIKPGESDKNEVLELRERYKFFKPKVSVIVPNFNHAPYLKTRLESIYKQNYSNFEVILLDDCSSDSSLSILRSYHARYPDITLLRVNEKNSGSPFAQWKLGMSLAKGDLIWIAESDDYCDLNFLEKLVPIFGDETVMLCSCRPVFIDRNNNRNTFSFDNYVSSINPEKWNTSYSQTAHNEVSQALAFKNTIPNVSGVIFRNPKGSFPLFDDVDWLSMRVCGDWVFYLNIIRGGKIAYCSDVNNYFRMYDESTSKKTHSTNKYYEEHESVACTISSMYNVPEEILIQNYEIIKSFYFNNVKNGSEEKFEKLYNLEKVFQCKEERPPNILMASYAMSIGGGEIVPIRLANSLKEKNVAVTFLNGNFEPTNKGVREMLLPHIPVITYSPTIDLRSLILDYGIECVHTHHASMEYLFSSKKIRGQTGTKHVATMHGMYESMDDFINDTRLILDEIDHWFYISNKNLIPFKKYGYYKPEMFSKINNGLKVPKIMPVSREQLGINENAFIVCITSRALPEKGWKEAISAVIEARQRTSLDIHLLLIGEGVVYEELKTRDLPNFIHLLGFQSNVFGYFASSDLGLLPSYFKGESFPLTIIECLFAGKPVIATEIGEIRNMITSGDDIQAGILVKIEPRDSFIGRISNAIIKMATDKDFYDNCHNNVEKVIDQFDIEKITDIYLDTYKKLVQT